MPPTTHRTGDQLGLDRAADQNLVPEPPHEGQEGEALHGQRRQRLAHLNDRRPADEIHRLPDEGCGARGGGRRCNDSGATRGPLEDAQNDGRGTEIGEMQDRPPATHLSDCTVVNLTPDGILGREDSIQANWLCNEVLKRTKRENINTYDFSVNCACGNMRGIGRPRVHRAR